MSDDFENDIAIVGMACRVPGASNTREFAQLLTRGGVAGQELSDEDLLAEGVTPDQLADPAYVKKSYSLDGYNLFDREFWGFSSKEAAILDPQHRQFLECAWEAIEDAGYDVDRIDDAVGVFAGSGHNAYMPFNLLTNPSVVEDSGMFLLRHTGNDKDFMTTRLSYLLDLQGPSVNIATACSTSLVALHYAAQSLLSGECDMALAGGVTINLPHNQGYLFKEGEILSPDGLCRPFDADASGTVFGSGAGVVVLKRYSDALEQKDNVLALIKGTAINNDGAGKVSYLAPSVEGQANCIAEAIEIADVDPATIGYLEAHGTGTYIGDPIEVAALTQAYRSFTDESQFCALGSVKANIGHLDTAAGVISLIKVILAMQQGEIFPTPNYNNPNPGIDFDSSPFFVADKLQPWRTEQSSPRRAGISSLGVGGTNAHVIVEQPPEASRLDFAASDFQLLTFSARSETALQDNVYELGKHLEANPGVRLPDVAMTLQEGRRNMAQRGYLVASSNEEASIKLLSADALSVCEASESDGLTFMFAGGGAQYPNMGLGLYQARGAYRDSIDECLALLAPDLSSELRQLLFPNAEGLATAAKQLQRPSMTIPALFITQYAMAQLWLSLGVKPSAMIGHSMGENTAACLAGVFSLKDALGLVSLRGKLFEQTASGGMLSVDAPADEIVGLLPPDITIACVNAPDLCVASGASAAISELQTLLNANGIQASRIRIEVAAHSPLLDPILPEFRQYLQSIELSAPTVPIISNLYGDWLTPAQAQDPEYWVEHLSGTVQFASGVRELIGKKPNNVLLEVGPGQTLVSLAKLNPDSKSSGTVTSMRLADDDEPDDAFFLSSVAQLWQKGVPIDWTPIRGEHQTQRVPLPTYQFEHRKYWIEPGSKLASQAATIPNSNLVSSEVVDYYCPQWQRTWPAPKLDLSEPAVVETLARTNVVVLGGPKSLNAAISTALINLGVSTWSFLHDADANTDAVAKQGSARLLDLLDEGSLLSAFSDITEQHGDLHGVIHLVGAEPESPLESAKQVYFDQTFVLGKVLSEERQLGMLKLQSVSLCGLRLGQEKINPYAALCTAASGVMAQEISNLQVQLIDFETAEAIEPRLLLDELLLQSQEKVTNLAYRAGLRHSPTFVQLPAPKLPQTAGQKNLTGTIVVTGGLGDLALSAIGQLAKPGIHFALLSRSGFLEPRHWDDWIHRYGVSDPASKKIESLRIIEKSGATLSVHATDIADVDRLGDTVKAIESNHNVVSGVLHTAGVLDDGLLIMKSLEAAHQVLKPKVDGTVALNTVLADHDLDFFYLYSSISAISRMAGQIDYAAANAFMDAFAQSRAGSNQNILSLAWPAWRDTGMASDQLNNRQYLPPPPGEWLSHPLFEFAHRDTGRCVYTSLFTTDSHWFIDEHRISGGERLLPGSGFLELSLAAANDLGKEQNVTLNNLQFIAPLVVLEGNLREVQTIVEDGRLTIQSRDRLDPNTEWELHSTAQISTAKQEPVQVPDVASLRARCTEIQRFEDSDHHPNLNLGRRWQALSAVNIGDQEALVELDLEPALASEVTDFLAHPAIVDMAVGGAQKIVPGYDAQTEFYVPMEYSTVSWFGPIPAKCFSHVRFRSDSGDTDNNNLITFDISVFDEQQNLLLEVSEFVLQKVEAIALTQASEESDALPANSILEQILDLGISTQQGVNALQHLIDLPSLSHVLIAKTPIDKFVGQLHDAVSASVSSTNTNQLEVDPDLELVERELVGQLGIADCAVARYGRGDRTHIVAYIVFDEGAQLTVSEMRKFLKSHVSAELVPQHFEELEQLPKNNLGKVNRNALYDPLGADDYVAPDTPTEQTIAKVWEDILGTEKIGRYDNFFDIGGHSLLSIRAIAAVEKATGARLNQKIMILQSLEQVAQAADEQLGVGADNSTVDKEATQEKESAGKGLFQRFRRK